MIGAISSLFAVSLVAPAFGETTEVNAFVSPCPRVFTYEPHGIEPGKWHGVVNLTTDITLYSLWLNIVLESKADILGNWVGEVTTDDNIDFKIENTKMKITPGPPLSVRFFIQYNAQKDPPKLKAIRFNGREICNVDNAQDAVYNVTPTRSDLDVGAPSRPGITTSTARSTAMSSRGIDRRHTTAKPNYWDQTKVTANPFWTTTKTESSQVKSDKTTMKSQYWQYTTKVVDTQQVKSEDRLQTTLKPQYWTQANIDITTKTTSRPQLWSQAKVDNNQNVSSDGKLQAQIITAENAQSTGQFWSQKKVTNNQLTRAPGSKQQTKSVNNSKTKQQTGHETTTQSHVWSHKLQTKNENKSDVAVKPSLWQQVKEVNNQQAPFEDRYNTKVEQKPQADVKQVLQTRPQYWTDTNVEDTSHILSENNQHVSDDGYQAKNYDVLQIKITDPRDNPVYVRPEDKDTVSFNLGVSQIRGEENNQRRTDNRQQITNEERLDIIPIKIQSEQTEGRQTDRLRERTSNWSGHPQSSRAEQTQSKGHVIFESAGETSSYNNDDRTNDQDSRISYDGYLLTTAVPAPANNLKKDEDESDSYFGGLPTIYIPNHPPRRTEPQCGKVILNKPESYIQREQSTYEGQWPWQIALYQQQTTVDFKYICGGTLVSPRHIITAAHCVTRKGSRRLVNKNTLTVYLGKYNLRTSVDGVQVKFVNKIIIHPEYNATTFSRDVAILELRESVTYSNWVQPACLWPEDEVELYNIVGKKGSVVGWGFEVTGVAREELSLLEMPVVDQDTCIRSYIEFYRRFTSDYTYCAGYKDGTSVCNGDSGGGMVFKKGNTWYLRGLASLSVARQGEYRCDPSHYVIFTDLAKLLPWIEENIDDY